LGRAYEAIDPELFNVPKAASTTILVEGLPSDASEREVAHIFRPFLGFKSVKIVAKSVESPDSQKNEKGNICYADFETSEQATAVVNTI